MDNKKPEFGFWTVNGTIDFAFMPADLIPVGVEGPIPIRLQSGTGEWGERHIRQEHGGWLLQQHTSAAEIVHRKLTQPGGVYVTEHASKFKVNISLAPAALLVLRFISSKNPFFTVVTVYFKDSGRIDGDYLGVYPGSTSSLPSSSPPKFSPPLAAMSATVRYRKRRTLSKAA